MLRSEDLEAALNSLKNEKNALQVKLTKLQGLESQLELKQLELEELDHSNSVLGSENQHLQEVIKSRDSELLELRRAVQELTIKLSQAGDFEFDFA